MCFLQEVEQDVLSFTVNMLKFPKLKAGVMFIFGKRHSSRKKPLA